MLVIVGLSSIAAHVLDTGLGGRISTISCGLSCDCQVLSEHVGGQCVTDHYSNGGIPGYPARQCHRGPCLHAS